MFSGDLDSRMGGGRQVQEGGNICAPIADSLYRIAEANTL